MDASTQQAIPSRDETSSLRDASSETPSTRTGSSLLSSSIHRFVRFARCYGVAILLGLLVAWPLARFLVATFLPPPPLLDPAIPLSRVVTDRHGEPLQITLARDDRLRVRQPLDHIAPEMIEATLLYEDQWYYWHPGVNPVSLARATWHYILGGGPRAGASTITMQLARLRYRLPTRTIPGKLWQIWCALQLECAYSKRELLEAYFTLAPYGGNIEGVEAASRVYFGKSSRDLTLAEATTLAVIPQSPARRSPVVETEAAASSSFSPEDAQPGGLQASAESLGLAKASAGGDLVEARNQLLARWVAKYPDDAGRAAIPAEGLRFYQRQDLPRHAPHLVRRLLAESATSPASRQRLVIRSTVDLSAQQALRRAADQFLAARSTDGLDNLAALLIDAHSGEVLASIGSADFFKASIEGQVDGTTMLRSPGSTLKPFVFGLAFDAGLIHPLTLLNDTPASYSGYAPENFGRGFAGPLSATDALTRSRNLPAVELARRLISSKDLLGRPNATTLYDLLRAARIPSLRETDHYGLSLALGAVDLSMIDLAGLYLALANGGVPLPVIDQLPVSSAGANRDTLPQPTMSAAPPKSRSLLSPEACFLVLDMLAQNPPPGTARDLIRQADFGPDRSRSSRPVAYKTGTSWAFRDAWCAAAFDRFVLITWVGHFDARTNPSLVGGKTAAPLAFSMIQALRERETDSRVARLPLHERFRLPPDLANAPRSLFSFAPTRPDQERTLLNVAGVELSAVSGALATRHSSSSRPGWFIPGVSPLERCRIERPVVIDRRTGKPATDDTPSADRESRVFEFWPSDVLELFRQAGIPRNTPPQGVLPDEPTGDAARRFVATESNASISILSPEPGLEYVAQPATSRSNISSQASLEPNRLRAELTLRARVSDGVRDLHWFVDSRYLGRQSADKPLSWQAPPGRYELRAVDERGRAATRRVIVRANP